MHPVTPLIAFVALSAAFGLGAAAQAYPRSALLAGTGAAGHTTGAASSALIGSNAINIAADMVGNLYIADREYHTIRRFDAAAKTITLVGGTVSTPGYQDGASARLDAPAGIAVTQAADNSGMVYFCDTNNYRVRSYNPKTGLIATVAGSGTSARVDGVGSGASFTTLFGITVARNGTIYVSEGVAQGFIRAIDPLTRAVTTVYALGGSGGVYGLALNPVFQDRLVFSTFAAVSALNMATRAVTTLSTSQTECYYLAELVNRTVVFTCASAAGRVFVRSPEGVETSIGGASTGYAENATGAGGLLFNAPKGVAALPVLRAVADVAVMDTGNRRVRLLSVLRDRTRTVPMTRTKSLVISPTKTRTLPRATTTNPPTTAPATTSTSAAPTTVSSTAVVTTTTLPPTTIASTTPAYTAAPNTSLVVFRFRNTTLPLRNATAMSLVFDLLDADARNLLRVAANESAVFVVRVPVPNATTAEVILTLQFPATMDALAVQQLVALARWPLTAAFIVANNVTTLASFCVSCAGPNCLSAQRPACARDNNNGVVIVVPPRTYACEEAWCILIVFGACFGAGVAIAAAAFNASRKKAAAELRGRTLAIREDRDNIRMKGAEDDSSEDDE